MKMRSFGGEKKMVNELNVRVRKIEISEEK